MHEMQPSTPFIIHPFSPGNTLLSIIENLIENSLHPKAYSNPEKDLNVMGSKSIHISFPIQQIHRINSFSSKKQDGTWQSYMQTE